VDQDFAVRAVDDPDLFTAAAQIIADFAPQVDSAFRRRNDFNRNIGRKGSGDSFGIDLAQVLVEKNREVGTADFVR
jgi:hypothetical protein